jgi:signal transduction histidine kinase
MALFSHRVSEALSVEEVLPRMAEAAAAGVGGSAGRVRLLLQDGGERVVRWPSEGDEPEGGYDRTLPISHLGETIGELSVAKGQGDPVTAEDERLLADLAGQAGIALHNVRLTIELSGRLEEISMLAAKLRASRQRIVAAQDEERRRLELRIRDETEPQLRSIGRRLSTVERDIATDPAGAAALLDQVAADADATLEGLRDLARGLFPPLLTDQGLVPAIEAQIRKSSVNASLEADGVAGQRFDPRAEAAAYFVCVEALRYADELVQGVHVTVRLWVEDEWLRFAVSGPGQPRTPEAIAAGRRYQPLVDRVEALGGSVEVRWLEDGKTELSGRVPKATAESSLVQTS